MTASPDALQSQVADIVPSMAIERRRRRQPSPLAAALVLAALTIATAALLAGAADSLGRGDAFGVITVLAVLAMVLAHRQSARRRREKVAIALDATLSDAEVFVDTWPVLAIDNDALRFGREDGTEMLPLALLDHWEFDGRDIVFRSSTDQEFRIRVFGDPWALLEQVNPRLIAQTGEHLLEEPKKPRRTTRLQRKGKHKRSPPRR